MNDQMRNLAIAVSDIVNDYIAKGMTTEEVCGVLCVRNFLVMQSSEIRDVPETDSVGGGSPIKED